MSAAIPCDTCEAECVWRHMANARMPCWGQIHSTVAVEDDGSRIYVHACAGHAPMCVDEPYSHEPSLPAVVEKEGTTTQDAPGRVKSAGE